MIAITRLTPRTTFRMPILTRAMALTPATRDEGLAAETLNRGGSTGDNELPPMKRKEGDDDEPSTSGLFDPVLAGTEDKYQFTSPQYLEKHF